MRTASSSKWKGLVTKSSAPASKASSTRSRNAVAMMTGICYVFSRALNSLQVSVPVIPGIFRSRMMSSGFSC